MTDFPRITIRPLRFVYEIGLSAVALVLYGWGAAVLVLAMAFDLKFRK